MKYYHEKKEIFLIYQSDFRTNHTRDYLVRLIDYSLAILAWPKEKHLTSSANTS